MVANTPDNRIAFAAIFIESFSADAEAALLVANLPRERAYATALHNAATDFCAVVNAQPTVSERSSSQGLCAPNDVRSRALSLASGAAKACSELALAAALDTDFVPVRNAANRCCELAILLLRTLRESEGDVGFP